MGDAEDVAADLRETCHYKVGAMVPRVGRYELSDLTYAAAGICPADRF